MNRSYESRDIKKEKKKDTAICVPIIQSLMVEYSRSDTSAVVSEYRYRLRA